MRYAIGIAIYVGVVAGFVAWAAIEPDSDGVALVVLIALIAVHPLAGVLIARWSAVFLALLLPVLAFPIPTPEDAYEPIPWWFVMLYVGLPVGAILIAAGVGVAKAWGYWQSTSAA